MYCYSTPGGSRLKGVVFFQPLHSSSDTPAPIMKNALQAIPQKTTSLLLLGSAVPGVRIIFTVKHQVMMKYCRSLPFSSSSVAPAGIPRVSWSSWLLGHGIRPWSRLDSGPSKHHHITMDPITIIDHHGRHGFLVMAILRVPVSILDRRSIIITIDFWTLSLAWVLTVVDAILTHERVSATRLWGTRFGMNIMVGKDMIHREG